MMRTGLIGLGLVLLSAPFGLAHGDGAVICDGEKFVFETGFLGGAVRQINNAGDVPFCVSDTPETVTKKLSFRDPEIWCVTTHHLSADSRPLAKNLWVLNKLSNKLYQYDYVMSDGNWVLDTENHKYCETLPSP
jgi:hypothetical protein